MLATMGFHVNNIVHSCLKKEKASDFNEMLLHHIATCSLYFCSIYSNSMGVGCVIAYLHDIADIFVALCKTLSTTEYEFLGISAFAACFIAWFWTRIYVLPVFIYSIFNFKGNETVQSYILINVIFLGVLQFMHIYWFGLFIKILVHKLTTGKNADLHSQKIDTKQS